MKTELSREEQEILESFESGEWIPVKNLSKRRAELIAQKRIFCSPLSSVANLRHI